MSNEAKMSLEEKIVQRLKDDTLMMAVSDEDMLTDLVRRAVNEALFQKTTIKEAGFHGRNVEKDSLVVEVAKDVVRPVCEQIARDMIGKVLGSAEVKAAINEAMPRMLFDAMQDGINDALRTIIEQSSWDAQQKVVEAIRMNTL